jgi:hypothetical protein
MAKRTNSQEKTLRILPHLYSSLTSCVSHQIFIHDLQGGPGPKRPALCESPTECISTGLDMVHTRLEQVLGLCDLATLFSAHVWAALVPVGVWGCGCASLTERAEQAL